MISRRSLLTGFAGLLAAPAIIKCSASLMPVKAFAPAAEHFVSIGNRWGSSIYLGIAQLKVEGGVTAFDSGAGVWPVAEPIRAGSAVTIGPDGRVRNKRMNDGQEIAGVAVSNSGPF